MPNPSDRTGNPKVKLIIDCALDCIREQGDQGLSMRNVAKRAGMSLSNVQYYFKTKDALLQGMVDIYFQQCESEYLAHMGTLQSPSPREVIRHLIRYGVNLAGSDMLRVFRELWVIAERNEPVRACMEGYYQAFTDELLGAFSKFSTNDANVRQAVGLVLSLYDGVDVAVRFMPLTKEAYIDMLTEAVLLALEGRLAGADAS